MKVVIKHRSDLLKELNFRIFEVDRVIMEKAVEVYVPELKRKIDFGLHEVLIYDLRETIDQFNTEGIKQEEFYFLMNWIEANFDFEGQYFVTSMDLFQAVIDEMKKSEKKFK
jgi:hypothetical protein